MHLLSKLTMKSLKLNKKRTIVTVIGIILSVALITAVAAMFFSARDSLVAFETRQKGDFHYVFFDVPIEDLKYFKENRNFEKIYYTKDFGYALLNESKNEFKPYLFLKGFDSSALEDLGIKLVEGRLPENDNEILIPTHLKTNGRVSYSIGDTLELEIGRRVSEGEELNQHNPYQKDEEEILDTKKMSLKIVGIMERPSSTVEDYSAPGYTLVTLLRGDIAKGPYSIYAKYNKEALKNEYEVTADILGVDREAFRYIYGNTEEYNPEKTKYFLEKVDKAKYNFDTNSYLIILEKGFFNDSTTQSLGIVVLIVVLIIIFTSVFCIKNSFNISITEKTKQYGMLSTVGATSKQIKRNVFYEAFLLGLFGIPLGILCGLFASYVLILISNALIGETIGFDLIYSFSWLSILFAVLLGLVTLYLSAWGSAHKASKITPIIAIRNSEEIKINPKKVKSPKYIKKLFGVGGDISYKNLKRNKKKYRATVISIIVCVSIFIALSSFIQLAFRSVQNEFDTADYNISLSYHLDSSSTIQNKALEVLQFDSIRDYSVLSNHSIFLENRYVSFSKEYMDVYPNIKEPIASVDKEGNPIEIYNENTIRVYRVGDHAYQNYIKSLGLSYDDAKEKGILINYTTVYRQGKNSNTFEKVTIPLYDYKKGDTLEWNLYTDRFDENNELIMESVHIPLALVTEKKPFGLSSTYGEDGVLIVSDCYFATLFQEKVNTIYEMIAIDSSEATKLQDQIEEHLNEEDYTLTNTEESVKMMRSFYTLVAIFLYGFITVIALIGITNIFNTITTNMELRSREFATLKSIGMTKKEFNRMIRLESIFYGMKSLLIGIPIGGLLSYLIYHFLTDGDSSIKYELPYMPIILSIVAVFFLVGCIMKYSLGKINKQNTIETIRKENI